MTAACRRGSAMAVQSDWQMVRLLGLWETLCSQKRAKLACEPSLSLLRTSPVSMLGRTHQ